MLIISKHLTNHWIYWHQRLWILYMLRTPARFQGDRENLTQIWGFRDSVKYNNCLMTSWHKHTFHITGPLWGELTGHRWVLLANGQYWGALTLSMLLAWTSCWTNNCVVGDLTLMSRYCNVCTLAKTQTRVSPDGGSLNNIKGIRIYISLK